MAAHKFMSSYAFKLAKEFCRVNDILELTNVVSYLLEILMVRIADSDRDIHHTYTELTNDISTGVYDFDDISDFEEDDELNESQHEHNADHEQDECKAI